MDKKRLIFAAIFILISIGMGYLLYRIFFAAPAPTPIDPGTTTTTPPGGFPTAGEGTGTVTPPSGLGTLPTQPGSPTQPGIVEQPTTPPSVNQFITDTVDSPRPSRDGSLQYYNEFDGKFYRVDKNGNTTAMSDQVFFNVDTVNWSPATDEAILEYPDGANIYYNFQTKQQVTLPKHWEEFSFSDDGAQVASKSITLSPENRWLIATSPDGSNVELIEPLGDNASKVDVSWSPNRQVVGLSRTGESLGADREEVLLVGKNGENFRSMVVEGRGFESTWSPTGDKLLYSVYSDRSDFKPELWISNASPGTVGEGRQPIRVNTWANKCTFADNRYVYCGVPKNLETGAGLVPGVAQNTPDDLYKIDTQTGAKTAIDLDQARTIEDIFVSEDGSTLYFTDRFDNGVFEVEI